MAYGTNKLLEVIKGPWRGNVAITTGTLNNGSYPIAKYTGQDSHDPSLAVFVQLGFRASEDELRPVTKEYLSDFKKRYRGLKITSKENPLVHELEIS